MTEHAHNHGDHCMPESLDCDRCKRKIEGLRELQGILAVTLSSPIMPMDSMPFILCFECGQIIANMLCPELKEDPTYQQAMAIGGIVEATIQKEKEDGLEG